MSALRIGLETIVAPILRSGQTPSHLLAVALWEWGRRWNVHTRAEWKWALDTLEEWEQEQAPVVVEGAAHDAAGQGDAGSQDVAEAVAADPPRCRSCVWRPAAAGVSYCDRCRNAHRDSRTLDNHAAFALAYCCLRIAGIAHIEITPTGLAKWAGKKWEQADLWRNGKDGRGGYGKALARKKREELENVLRAWGLWDAEIARSIRAKYPDGG